MEGIFRNWNPFVVHSKKPITGKPYQKGCQNQQPSIDNGAPLEECSNHVVIHGHYPFWFLRLTRTRSATAGKGELCFHFILHNSSFSLAALRPAVRCIA